MACCLMGHGEADLTAQVETQSPPCHETHSEPRHDVANADHEPASPFECPGCLDCDTAIMQVQSVDGGAVLAQASPEIPIAVLASRFAGFEHKAVVFKTGPPGDPPTTHQTPITLKQRLLI